MSITEVHDVELDAATAALTALAELVCGNPQMGIAPGALSKAIKAAFLAFRRGHGQSTGSAR